MRFRLAAEDNGDISRSPESRDPSKCSGRLDILALRVLQGLGYVSCGVWKLQGLGLGFRDFTSRGRGLSKLVISRVIIRVTPFSLGHL